MQIKVSEREIVGLKLNEASRFLFRAAYKIKCSCFLFEISPISPFTLSDFVNEFLRQEYQLRTGLTTFPERSGWKQSNAAWRGLPSALKSIDPQIAARIHLIFAVVDGMK